MRKLAESTKLFSKFPPNNSTSKHAYLDLCLVSSSSVTLTLPLDLQFQGMKGMFSLEIFFAGIVYLNLPFSPALRALHCQNS